MPRPATPLLLSDFALFPHLSGSTHARLPTPFAPGLPSSGLLPAGRLRHFHARQPVTGGQRRARLRAPARQRARAGRPCAA